MRKLWRKLVCMIIGHTEFSSVSTNIGSYGAYTIRRTVCLRCKKELRKEDAIFIAEARTGIPKLLAEVKYLANQHLMSAVIISEKDAEIERLRNLINGGDSE